MSVKRAHRVSSGRAALVSAAALVLGFGVVGSAVDATAQAGPSEALPPPIWGKITSDNGLCLEVTGASRAEGTPVQLATCNGTAAQWWKIDNYPQKISALGLCLTPRPLGDEQYIHMRMYKCGSYIGNQWWSYDRGRLINRTTGLCLDVQGNHQVPRNPVQLYRCNWTSAQNWHVPAGV